jgi:hypothetical protein
VVCVWKAKRFKCVNFGGVCLESWKVRYYLTQKHSLFNQFFSVPLLR